MALTTVRSTGIGSLPAISGANLTSLNASNISRGTLNSARFSGGKVLQVVQGTQSSSVGSTSNSYVTTNLTASITPSSSSNKVLAYVSFKGRSYKDTGNSTESSYALYRASSVVYNTSGAVTMRLGASYSADGLEIATMQNFMYLDTPSATTSQTYTLYMKAGSNATVTAHVGMVSTLTLLEIAA